MAVGYSGVIEGKGKGVVVGCSGVIEGDDGDTVTAAVCVGWVTCDMDSGVVEALRVSITVGEADAVSGPDSLSLNQQLVSKVRANMIRAVILSFIFNAKSSFKNNS